MRRPAGCSIDIEPSLREQVREIDAGQLAVIDALRSLPTRSLYLWGPPGRGKTWLAGTYFDALPDQRKLRVHCHEFFRDLHDAIAARGPDLDAALDSLVLGYRVVYFDEFHVHDVADARYVDRLLRRLIEHQATVILTSNYAPAELLPNPLFHDMFLAAIDIIESTTTVIKLDDGPDYRELSMHTNGFSAGWWVSPGTGEQLTRLGLDRPDTSSRQILRPAGHDLVVDSAEAGQLWGSFAQLCERPTSSRDFLALANVFRRWVISDVPTLSGTDLQAAQRFSTLIDVLADQDVSLVVLSAHGLEHIADSPHSPVDIARTLSRLRALRTIEID